MLTWPNRITLVRICLIPFFVMAVLQVQSNPETYYRYVAFVLFLIMVVTDAVDGLIARLRGERSFLGRILDPLADKFLLTTACVLLACDFWPQPRLPNWVPVMVISRDIIIVLGVVIIYLMTGSIKPGPTLLGKLTTMLQMVTVLLTLLNNHVPVYLVRLSWWMAVVFTGISGLQYIYIGSRQFNYAGALDHTSGQKPSSDTSSKI